MSAAAGCIAANAMAIGIGRSWSNQSGGQYESTTNWSGNVVPGINDGAVFNTGAFSNYTVTFQQNFNTASLLVND